MKSLLFLISLIFASAASAGDIDWTNNGSAGGVPIAPPGNDPGFTVGPLVPTSFIPPDNDYYAHCGAGYSCNFLKSGAERRFQDEARQKADAEIKSYRQKLDQEKAKIDKDLDALRQGRELSESPEGKAAQADLKKAQALRESARATREETLDFVKAAEQKAADDFAVKFGLANDEQSNKSLEETKAKLDLSSGKTYLQQRIRIGLEKADMADAKINKDGGEYRDQRLTFTKMGRASLGMAQAKLDENDIRTAQIAYKIGMTFVDIGLGFVPGVSTFKDGYEALLGKNMVTGETLTRFERTMAAVGVITLGVGSAVGKTLRAAEKGAEIFKDIAKATEAGEDLVKVVDDAGDAIKTAEALGAKTAGELGNFYQKVGKEAETVLENSESLAKNAIPKMTPAQIARTNRIENTIKDHAKPHDFEGVIKELKGEKILGSDGKVFNHIQEMKESKAGLEKSSGALRDSLKNPNLDNAVREYLASQVTRADEVIKKMESALSGKELL